MQPSSPVQSLVDALPKLRHLDGLELAQALGGSLDLPALLAEARFAGDRYTRVCLHRDAHVELRLLCWNPGQSSALHGHGGSACAFRVLRGTATELRLGAQDRVLREGAVAVAEAEGVHQVANLGSGPLITLHAYSPPLPVDQPSGAEGHRVVIVGGGWSGAATALHLLATGDPELRITIVEKAPSLARGVAYSTWDPAHLLNVPAARMSLFPKDPDDFVRFARERGAPADPDSLLPRWLYGDYVEDRLRRQILQSPGRLRVCRGEAVALERSPRGWVLTLGGGRALEADDVVLATGNAPPRVPEGLRVLARDPRMIQDPWAPGAVQGIPRGDRVLVVGTGLTALDILGSLRRQGHRGPLHVVSRNGRWPMPHLAQVTWKGRPWEIDPEDAPRRADELAAWVHEEVARAASVGVPWQAVLGALRHHTAALWGRLPLAERRRFLEVHRGQWEVARHRAPGAALEDLRRWRSEGWFTQHRGGVLQAWGSTSGLQVALEGGLTIEVDRVVVCTGGESDPRAYSSPLWRQVLEEGLALPDPLGLGVLTDKDSGVLGRQGRTSGLWALGALQRPRLYESTSVPDLILQVQALAERLAMQGELSAGAGPERARPAPGP